MSFCLIPIILFCLFWQLCFPVIQDLGTKKDKIAHWYMLSVNMPAKRFEILDSLRGPTNLEMIEHANKLVDAIKTMYRVNYSESRRQIDSFELQYVPVPKQLTGLVLSFLIPFFHLSCLYRSVLR